MSGDIMFSVTGGIDFEETVVFYLTTEEKEGYQKYDAFDFLISLSLPHIRLVILRLLNTILGKKPTYTDRWDLYFRATKTLYHGSEKEITNISLSEAINFIIYKEMDIIIPCMIEN